MKKTSHRKYAQGCYLAQGCSLKFHHYPLFRGPRMASQKNSEEELSELENIMKILSNYQKARNQGLVQENLQLEELLTTMKQTSSSSPPSIRLPGHRNDDKIIEDYEEIVPQPFFVIKTTNDKGTKVFINICGTFKIPTVGDWEKGVPMEVEEALSESDSDLQAENIKNVHVPLSCSDPTTSMDHCNNLCLVYDVVFNMTIVRHAMVHKSLKFFLVNLALTWIGQKYDTPLCKEFRLPRMRYKGDFVRKHYIKANSKVPLVTEVDDAQPSFPLLSCKFAQEDPVEGLQNIVAFEQQNLEVHKTPQASTQVPMNLCVEGVTKSNEDSSCSTHTSFLQSMPKPNVNLEIIESPQPGSLILDGKAQDIQEAVKDTHMQILSGYVIENHEQSDPKDEPCKENEASHVSPLQQKHGTFASSYSISKLNPDFEEKVTSDIHKSFEDHENAMLYSPSQPSQSVQIETSYCGSPVEYTLLTISFAQPITVDDMEIFLSNHNVLIQEMTLGEIITIPLIFDTSARGVEACFDSVSMSLRIILPFIPYFDKLPASEK